MASPAIDYYDSTVENLEPKPLLHSDIAALAYALWQQRGRPDGSPEEDWFRAENELKARG